VAAVRASLDGRERVLFDLACFAGQLGHDLPGDANMALISGATDPRRRLRRSLAAMLRARQRSFEPETWHAAVSRLTRHLVRELKRHDGEEPYRKLRILLGNSSIGLAPDGAVPADPVFRAAWATILDVFSRLYSSQAKPLGRLAWLNRRRLAVLERELFQGLKRGRSASGMRPGLEGRKLAIDPRLMTLASTALSKTVTPAYGARYVFYTKPGDFFWPHPDDPEFAVNILVCISRALPPGRSSGSAFLAYRRDGSVERHELLPGDAIAVEARGCVHGREPLVAGEHVALLSICANCCALSSTGSAGASC
jgi:hypothetical protein